MPDTVVSPLVRFVEAACPSKVRPLWQFLQEEIVPPDGPKKDEPLDPRSPPWLFDLLQMMADPRWTESWLTGPRQTGKTLLGFEAPLLYHLFELKEDVICLVPEMDKASLIWRKKIEPVIRHTRYRDLLPVTGKGSRGGDFRLITFLHGVSLTFMGASAADPPSSATARVVVITEANEMRVSETGDQGNPVDAVRECTSSFPNPRIYGESIITTEQCITWEQITKTGTHTRVMLRCPSCGTFQFPERGRFHGWEDAKNPIEAGERSGYHCFGCEAVWDETMRAQAIQAARVVHGTQTIAADGTISGPEPKTRCLGARYNAMCHPFRTMADIAEREWNARNLGTDQAEMAICQYTWAQPYVPKVKVGTFDHRYLAERSKASTYHQGEVPHWAQFMTVACDVQEDRHYWLSMAHGADHRAAIIDWGYEHLTPIDPITKEPIKDYTPTPADRVRVMDAIAQRCRQGWPRQGTPHERLTPVWSGIDTGWLPEEIYAWVATQPDWVALRGVGATIDGKRDSVVKDGPSALPPELAVRLRGVLDVVRPKSSPIEVWNIMGSPVRNQMHSSLKREIGAPASVEIPKDLKSSNYLLLHLTAEIWTLDEARSKWYWRSVRSSNHLGDCAVYARAMGWYEAEFQALYGSQAQDAPPPQPPPIPDEVARHLGTSRHSHSFRRYHTFTERNTWRSQ